MRRKRRRRSGVASSIALLMGLFAQSSFALRVSPVRAAVSLRPATSSPHDETSTGSVEGAVDLRYSEFAPPSVSSHNAPVM